MGLGGGGLMQTMATGMAFGAGSEIAHQGVRAMMGGGGGHGQAPAEQQQYQEQPQQYQQQAYPQQMQQAQPQYDVCQSFSQTLMNCLKSQNDNISMCQQYMDDLNQCQKDSQYNTQTRF